MTKLESTLHLVLFGPYRTSFQTSLISGQTDDYGCFFADRPINRAGLTAFFPTEICKKQKRRFNDIFALVRSPLNRVTKEIMLAPMLNKPRCLTDYNSEVYGPLFAVSDEGSARQTVVDAAYASAKAEAFSPIDLFELGVILDGERMTSSGEVPIGPIEYRDLCEAVDSLLLTTNVGVRANARLTQLLPEFKADVSCVENAEWQQNIVKIFEPSLRTPDGRPRPLTIRLSVTPSGPLDFLKPLVEMLERARAMGKIGSADVHRFSVLATFDKEISTDEQLMWIEKLMVATASAGLKEVAIDGELLPGSRQRLGVQSLLNLLSPAHLQRLLKVASDTAIQLTYRYHVDVESVARTIWTGLATARQNGFIAGKYGLVPLTLEEQATVIELLTNWTVGWTAIPAFYVDTPLESATDVYDVSRCAEAARVWLKKARGAGATIVLFDCPDRVTPNPLVRLPGENKGLLTIEEIEGLLAYAQELGVSILWSGQIKAPQAFELAKRKVFGIFSTSSTAHKMAVTAQFESDPLLAAENEPTGFGVRRMHAIIQGGFLTNAMAERDGELTQTIKIRTERLIALDQDAQQAQDAINQLNPELVKGWREIKNSSESERHMRLGRASSVPVPADAVRVFQGRRRRDSLSHEKFFDKLGKVFMPMTVQMQRMYGLTAYLPLVLPDSKADSLPDELALVFYRTQGAYQYAKRCVGGRAYSEMHDLVFDMPASRTGFPELFVGKIAIEQPYHLWERSVDWQMGYTRVFVGTRSATIQPETFLSGICEIAARLQKNPKGLDAAIFCAGRDWFAWWGHSQQPIDLQFEIQNLADKLLESIARRLRMPTSLTDPYAGIALDGCGDFVNFQFERVS